MHIYLHYWKHFFLPKESEHLLKDTKIDSDAKTRHQSNEINKLIPEAESKKPKLTKNTTMIATAKVFHVYLRFFFSGSAFFHSTTFPSMERK